MEFGLTDLDRLHKTHDHLLKYGSWDRRIGKTFYTCHVIAGYCEVLKNESIGVLLESFDRARHFTSILKAVLLEHDFEIVKELPAFKRIVLKNGNEIKFFTIDGITNFHPIDLNIPWNQYLISDLERMSPRFYNDNITIANIDKIKDHLDYRKFWEDIDWKVHKLHDKRIFRIKL